MAKHKVVATIKRAKGKGYFVDKAGHVKEMTLNTKGAKKGHR